MPKTSLLSRLSIRLTIAFLLASILGVVLVAVLAYRSTSSEFSSFLSQVQAMEQMMGGAQIINVEKIENFPGFPQAFRAPS